MSAIEYLASVCHDEEDFSFPPTASLIIQLQEAGFGHLADSVLAHLSSFDVQDFELREAESGACAYFQIWADFGSFGMRVGEVTPTGFYPVEF